MNNLISLNQIDVSTPCLMDWEKMSGDDRERHCSKCVKNVYNISAMEEDEAIEFLNSRGDGRTCVRFLRRPDGTVVTGLCPMETGLKKRRLQFSLAGLLILLTMTATACGAAPWVGKKIGPIVERWFDKPEVQQPNAAAPNTPAMGSMMVVGELVAPIPPTAIPPATPNETN